MKKIFLGLIFILIILCFNVKALNNVEKDNFSFKTVDMCILIDNNAYVNNTNLDNTVEKLSDDSINPPKTGIKVNYTLYAIVFVGIIILKKIYNYSKK